MPARCKLGSKLLLDPVVNTDDAKSGRSQLLRPMRFSGARHSDKRQLDHIPSVIFSFAK
jgi:hypothetical protein